VRAFLLASVLLGAVLAGCATPEPPPAPREIPRDVKLGEVFDIEVPLPDGVILRGRAFLPDMPGPHATILEAGPYYWNYMNMDRLEDAQNDTLRGRPGNYSRAGFAYVVVGLRGTGTSDGCYAFFNPQDGPDVASTIEWIAAQPWSDGNVGMSGQSYNGWTQDIVAATGAPPALKAIVSVSGVPDLWALTNHNGLGVGAYMPAMWTSGTALNTFALLWPTSPNPHPHAPPAKPEHVCGETTLAADQMRESLEGRKGPAMRGADLRSALANSTVPAIRTVGLAGDGHVMIADYSWDLMPSPRRLVVGQYGHATPVSQMPDWHDQMIAFYDHHLRGGPAPLAEDRVDYQDDDLVWRSASQWPPTDRVAKLYAAGGKLSLDPGPPASTRAVACCRLAADFTPCDEPLGTMFVSPPVLYDVTFAGTPRMDLTVTSTSPQDVLLGGILRATSEYPCRSKEFRYTSYFLGDLRHAKDHEEPSDFPVGTPSGLWLNGFPFATTVKAGERIAFSFTGAASVLEIAGGDKSTITLPIAVGELAFAKE
jgi:hypothetical protein